VREGSNITYDVNELTNRYARVGVGVEFSGAGDGIGWLVDLRGGIWGGVA